MQTKPVVDVVVDSVAAYSPHVEQYAIDNRDRMARQIATFIEILGEPAGRSVIDVGCGPGRDLARFTQMGCRAVGIDLNADFVDQGWASGPRRLRRG